MNSKPWILSTLILAVLTLADWSGMKVAISVGALKSAQTPALSQAVSTAPTSNTTAQIPTVAASSTPKVIKLDVPAYDKSSGPKRTVSDLLATSRAKEIYQNFPKEGSTSPFGIKMTVATQKELAGLDKSLPVPTGKEDAYQALTAAGFHPCCDGELTNCSCEHAVAMRGIIKKYLAEGKSVDEVRAELVTWEKFWWPRHYVIMALFDEATGRKPSVTDYYSSIYGTISNEKPALDYLLYQ
jgi:hypothetical protein